MSISTDKPFFNYASFLAERYGERTWRVPVDLGLGCPHRDTDGLGGCTFCGASGSRAIHLKKNLSIAEQVNRGLNYARERYGASAFILYFQAFTSTNAPVETLRTLFEEALDIHPFRAISISTRPDCLPPEVLRFLAELGQQHDLWVELGVQTFNDATLKRINRGHDAACAEHAIRALSRNDINVIPHVILGLPGETRKDFRETAARLAQLPVAGMKIHNLHIVQDTVLAEEWRRGEVEVFDEHEYAEILIDFLRRIPADRPIMRLLADTPLKSLLAPRWSMKKGQFLQYLERRMLSLGVRQGDLVMAGRVDSRDPEKTAKLVLRPPEKLVPDYAPALLEAVELPESPEKHPLAILDIGFGFHPLGIDVAQYMVAERGDGIRLVGLGEEAKILSTIRQQRPSVSKFLARLALQSEVDTPLGEFSIYWGDPRANLFRLRGRAEILVLEYPHVEPHVSLFSIDFWRRALRVLKTDGVVLSTCSNNAFRGALTRLGFAVGSADPKLVPGGGTIATRKAEKLRRPLDEKKMKIIRETLAGIPYRDRMLTWSRKHILHRRTKVVKRLREFDRR